MTSHDLEHFVGLAIAIPAGIALAWIGAVLTALWIEGVYIRRNR